MNKHFCFKTSFKASLIVAAMLALPMAQAASMDKAQYKTAKDRISAEYKTDKAACGSMSGNAKDICIEEAKAKEKVARAETEYSYTGKAKDGTKVWTAKADAAFAVAKEKCDDLRGNAKDVCRQEAKTTHTKALADAKMGKQVAEARTDASQTKRDADYKLAAEKCDSMSGDAKSQCLDNAKRTFGKM